MSLVMKARQSGARDESARWIIERLESWGAWASSGGQSNSYGASCLTLEEIRSMPVRAFIPVSEPECDQLHAALRKLPLVWFQLAGMLYIERVPVRMAAQKLGMSQAQAYRVQHLLFKGIEFCLRNPRVKEPPLHLLLKS